MSSNIFPCFRYLSQLTDCRLASLVKVMMSLAITFTYPLQFYVAVDIMSQYLQPHIHPHHHIRAEYALRLVLVLVTFGLAAAIPQVSCQY